MPAFPKPETILTREQAINAILTSIAMEEAALSHIINAEGEKIQQAIEHAKSKGNCSGMRELLEINESAAKVIEQINDLQMLLKNKLRIVAGCIPPKPDHKCRPTEPERHPKSCHPVPRRPVPLCFSCVSEFTTASEWARGSALCLKDEHKRKNCIRLSDENSSLIVLNSGKKYRIELQLEPEDKTCPISAELELRCGCGSVRYARMEDELRWETPVLHMDSVLQISLLSPERVRITEGKVVITEQKKC